MIILSSGPGSDAAGEPARGRRAGKDSLALGKRWKNPTDIAVWNVNYWYNLPKGQSRTMY